MNFLTLLLAASVQTTISVEGDGYLRFVQEGRTVYAKAATLHVRNGQLASIEGPRLLPAVAISSQPTGITVSEDGRITIDTNAGSFVAGRIRLARFPSNATLEPVGSFLVATLRPELGFPGENGFGNIGHLGQPETPRSLQSNSSVRIVVKPRSEVSSDRFKLGDIAEVKAPEAIAAKLRSVDIGDSPSYGVERGIDRSQVLGRLRMAKVLPEDVSIEVPASAVVVRKSQFVEHTQIVDAARAAAAQELGMSTTLTEEGKGTKLSVPPGKLTFEAEAVANSRDKVRVTIAILVDGKRYNSRTIIFDKPRPLPGVKSGEVVRIRIRSGDALVESRGKALGTANVGDRVGVKTETGTELSGQVVEPGVVEILA